MVARVLYAAKAVVAFVFAVLSAAAMVGLPSPYDVWVSAALAVVAPVAVYFTRNGGKPGDGVAAPIPFPVQSTTPPGTGSNTSS
jgi:hypothetical protein